MRLILKKDAPEFAIPGVTFIGLAAPSRGATETAVWRAIIAPETPGQPHALTREEIFVALAGAAEVTVDGETQAFRAGDCLIVKAGQQVCLANPHREAFELIAVLPIGGQAVLGNGEAFTPPWAA
ncbi:MAG: cupin domain-containing protein [Elstera sp.]|jgi:quercetin dioxygenase-like cupin family protein|uniref:cupin domain-containing protein n=1 Tax=Elstera sp. TaxID=1916664 RepID=UPI0037C0FB01